ncbi:hypothetical protein SXIM_04910 [Streptomyces xiamenensis]|uniref:Uncharacterized protein n=1 Tax=Streptomyces xiamenensis TaxID=408015 RepID=A0A0F7FR02_9ACTN|nr:hypothetical protein SXIM_04910 [Streptomyces xiamenensis]
MPGPGPPIRCVQRPWPGNGDAVGWAARKTNGSRAGHTTPTRPEGGAG